MYKLFVLLIIILANSLCYGQVTGFMDIPFGTPFNTAYQTVSKKQGCLISRSDRPYILALQNCKFGGYNSDFLILNFIEGKFSKSTILIQPNTMSSDLKENTEYLFADFLRIESNLKSKYGSPLHSFTPRKLKDYEGKEYYDPEYNSYYSSWFFPKGCKDRKDCSYFIILEAVNRSNGITLKYEDVKRENMTNVSNLKDY